MDDTEDSLAQVTQAHRAVLAANNRLDDVVQQARQNGATWQQIGDAIGITKQAASQRFHRSPAEHSEASLQKIQEELNTLAEEAFSTLARNDIDHLHSLMTYLTARQLSKRQVSKVWNQVVEHCGEYIELNNSRIEHSANSFILTYRLRHEHGEPVGQILFNTRKQITGLVIFLNDSAELPW
ncbi:hypothetical protein [uncultured Rothia sp.]|uniref:hypothetical protein n=1 Tax=uncultured Rothia sp. TaxID=316088 RepID=UPI00321757E5